MISSSDMYVPNDNDFKLPTIEDVIMDKLFVTSKVLAINPEKLKNIKENKAPYSKLCNH